MKLRHYVSVLVLAVIASVAIVPQLTFAQTQLPDKCVVDIVIMGDESGSINFTEFGQERDFIIGILNNLPISPGNTKAAVGFFDHDAAVIHSLTDDKTPLIATVNAYSSGNGNTDIGEAIRKAQEELDANARPSVQSVIVILTDGSPTGTHEDEGLASDAARAKGSLIFAVGIGNSAFLSTLQRIANDPDDQFVFQTEFDTLQDFIDSLRDSVCEVVGQIDGTIFVDVNQNGIWDIGEIGAANVPVNLYLADEAGPGATPAQTTTTDANGHYIFDVSGGNYILEVPSASQELMPTIDFDQPNQRTEVIEILTSQIISDVDGAVKPELACSFQSPPLGIDDVLPTASFVLLSPSGDLVPVSGVDVTVSLNPDTATLSGTSTVATASGVAEFSDLSVGSSGTYNLVGSVGDPLNLLADCSVFDVIGDPPIAVDDSYTTDQDTPLPVPVPGLLANDSDPNGDTIFIASLDATSTEGGTVSDTSPDGSFTYTPPLGFTGFDTFTYQISDGEFLSNVATVTIEVLPVITTPPPGSTETVTPPSCVILGMELWNADTDSLIGPLPNGVTIDLVVVGDANLTIIALTQPTSVGSVAFTLLGAHGYVDNENATPYSIFGDDEHGDYHGQHLPVGNYTITASAYTEAYNDGELCAQLVVNFSVIDTRQAQGTEQPQSTQDPQSTEEPTGDPFATQAPPNQLPVVQITGFALVDADTDTAIGPLTNGATVDTDAIGTRNLNIVAETLNAGSVIFTGSFPRNENTTPFSAGGDNSGDYLPISMSNGSYSVTAYAFSEAYGNGASSAPVTVNFMVTGTE